MAGYILFFAFAFLMSTAGEKLMGMIVTFLTFWGIVLLNPISLMIGFGFYLLVRSHV